MKHLTFNWHIAEFIQHCKEEIHLPNIVKAKCILIGGAGLKMLASQSLMLQLVGVKLLALKTGLAKFGILSILDTGNLLLGFL